jgi:hypothetical protein
VGDFLGDQACGEVVEAGAVDYREQGSGQGFKLP